MYHAGRPKKPAFLKQGRSENKAQLKARDERERKLMGKTDKIENVPQHLDSLGKAYYKFLVTEMKNSGLLCNLDIFLLAETADIISKLFLCNQIINNDGMFLTIYDRFGNPISKPHPTMKTKDKYLKQYMSFTKQLGLSPLSNVQLSKLNAKKAEEEADPLLQLLKKHV
ncbi:phage terminase small subunit P27 family [Priestia aryabhattai]|uniref:phage terminase small subunit P27 family n=1 Tax=Priestia aryabhattai TaxID=412384 RepID=UPI0026587419|nr:phage terminase small subunit P27 family [Priestia aryabhattai]WKG30180.1 phage terminase small subunit P27 family [Priestia aryabhattai]